MPKTPATKTETVQQEKPTEEKELTQEQLLQEVFKSDDGQEYLKIVETTGQTTKAELFENEEKGKEFLVDLQAWKASNKPKPTAPDIKQNIKVPYQYYRIVRHSKEFMYKRYQNGDTEGVEHDIVYSTETNEVTKEVFQTSGIESDTIRYTIPFDAKEAKEWVKYAQTVVKTSQNFQCMLEVNGTLVVIPEESFHVPIKELEAIIYPRKTF